MTHVSRDNVSECLFLSFFFFNHDTKYNPKHNAGIGLTLFFVHDNKAGINLSSEGI